MNFSKNTQCWHLDIAASSEIDDVVKLRSRSHSRTFKKWDFKGVSRDDFEGDFDGYFKVSIFQRVFYENLKGDLEEDLEGHLMLRLCSVDRDKSINLENPGHQDH